MAPEKEELSIDSSRSYMGPEAAAAAPAADSAAAPAAAGASFPPIISEPQAGWSVVACHYYASYTPQGPINDDDIPACCYLACDEGGNSRGLQWWSTGEPTPFHGSWTMRQGMITLRFHCCGPFHAPDPGTGLVRLRRLKTTHARRVGQGVYVGEDEVRRQVRIEMYGAYTVRSSDDGQKLLWSDQEMNS